MQDDKTISSEATAKHRNSNSRREASEASLRTVPSTESTGSSTPGISNRRAMRLSEKMSIVKQRRGTTVSIYTSAKEDTLSPTTLSPSSSYSSKKKVSLHADRDVRATATDENESAFEDADEDEEEDMFSEYSTPLSAAGIGIISPVSDKLQTHREEGEKRGAQVMDRIESQRDRHDAPKLNNFLAQPGLLEGVPEEGNALEQRKEEIQLTGGKGTPSTSTSFTTTTIHRNHQRTPGGAAAKLMLLGPQQSMEEDLPTPRPSPDSSTGSDMQNMLQAALDHARNQVKSQFNIRPVSDSHAAGNQDEVPVDILEYRTKLAKESPNLFDRSEVFFASAEASVVALQGAHTFAPLDSHSVYSRTSGAGPLANHPSDSASVAASVTSAFQISDEGEGNTFESLSRKDIGDELLSPRGKIMVEALPDEMQDPNPTLAHLLQSIASPPEGDIPDLGYTVRRKNACGALQVLTAPFSNRIPLAWTVGVLPALTSVLSDTGVDGLNITYPDKRQRSEFEIARNRAISCITNLAIPKENRIPILHSPDLVHWVVAMILEGRGLPRKGACAILAYLAKTPENRLLMVQIPRLIEALTKVLKPRPPRLEYPQPHKRRSDSTPEVGYDDDDEDEGDNTTEGGRTEATGSTEGQTDGEDAPSVLTDVHSVEASSRRSGVGKTESALSEPSKLMSVNSSYSNQSGATQRLAGARSPVELKGYDETADEHLREARNYAFAALSNLVKEKDNAFHFARDAILVKTMSEIAHFHEAQSHEHAVKFLANLTRHRLNSKTLVFRRRCVVPALVEATASSSDVARLYSCYGLQNLSQDKSCRQELAIAENLLVCLCERARGATEQETERLAALSALKNLTDEPANLIPMSNTTDCIATLMHLAHGRQEGVTPLMQYRACDALATLSHWLRKIATSGQALSDAKAGRIPNSKELFVPSLRVVTVNQWQ